MVGDSPLWSFLDLKQLRHPPSSCSLPSVLGLPVCSRVCRSSGDRFSAGTGCCSFSPFGAMRPPRRQTSATEASNVCRGPKRSWRAFAWRGSWNSNPKHFQAPLLWGKAKYCWRPHHPPPCFSWEHWSVWKLLKASTQSACNVLWYIWNKTPLLRHCSATLQLPSLAYHGPITPWCRQNCEHHLWFATSYDGKSQSSRPKINLESIKPLPSLRRYLFSVCCDGHPTRVLICTAMYTQRNAHLACSTHLTSLLVVAASLMLVTPRHRHFEEFSPWFFGH